MKSKKTKRTAKARAEMTDQISATVERTEDTPFSARIGSASPVTDDAWEAYNRKACGLHYVAHKMRDLEIDARTYKAELSKSLDREAALKAAIENIIKQQPCCEGGGCFYPMHDGDGDYIGEQNVDPLGVIQGMVQTAQDALTPNLEAEARR